MSPVCLCHGCGALRHALGPVQQVHAGLGLQALEQTGPGRLGCGSGLMAGQAGLLPGVAAQSFDILLRSTQAGGSQADQLVLRAAGQGHHANEIARGGLGPIRHGALHGRQISMVACPFQAVFEPLGLKGDAALPGGQHELGGGGQQWRADQRCRSRRHGCCMRRWALLSSWRFLLKGSDHDRRLQRQDTRPNPWSKPESRGTDKSQVCHPLGKACARKVSEACPVGASVRACTRDGSQPAFRTARAAPSGT